MSKLSFDVTGMHCASCAAAVERAVKKLPGASDVYVNFAANRLTLEAAPELTPEQVADAVRKAGFGAKAAHPAGTAAVPAERKLSFDVTGMHCASCAAAVERAVKKLPSPPMST